MTKISRFIIVDDDHINNLLCRIVIKEAVGDIEIQAFTVPEKGFAYLMQEYTEQPAETPTVLFLDINMPTWSGWDFLDNFEKLSEQAKGQIKIYMLSSSVDPRDKERARLNKNVADYFEKPLNRKAMQAVVSGN